MKMKKGILAALAVVTFTAQPVIGNAEEDSFGPEEFDLQAHRGGIGLTVESTIASFSRALEEGVSTLELDVQITEDQHAVVTHDRVVSGEKCQDTGAAYDNDPEYPYVGDYVKNLTLDQLNTLDCGSQTLFKFPGQEARPGARMPLLSDVFNLVKLYDADDVWMNIETKVEAGAPEETAPREEFVQIVAHEIREAEMIDRVSIQSFDWGALMRMQEVEPRLPVVALTNGPQFLQPGEPGASPWLGGIDIDDFDGDLVEAAHSFGADAISPVHGFPQNGKVTEENYEPYVTKEMVEEAQRKNIKVIPWTVNDKPTMEKLVNDGIDGLITDYPDRLRDVMKEKDLDLPERYEVEDDESKDELDHD